MRASASIRAVLLIGWAGACAAEPPAVAPSPAIVAPPAVSAEPAPPPGAPEPEGVEKLAPEGEAACSLRSARYSVGLALDPTAGPVLMAHDGAVVSHIHRRAPFVRFERGGLVLEMFSARPLVFATRPLLVLGGLVAGKHPLRATYAEPGKLDALYYPDGALRDLGFNPATRVECDALSLDEGNVDMASLLPTDGALRKARIRKEGTVLSARPGEDSIVGLHAGVDVDVLATSGQHTRVRARGDFPWFFGWVQSATLGPAVGAAPEWQFFTPGVYPVAPAPAPKDPRSMTCPRDVRVVVDYRKKRFEIGLVRAGTRLSVGADAEALTELDLAPFGIAWVTAGARALAPTRDVAGCEAVR